jgi:hypothetical protein
MNASVQAILDMMADGMELYVRIDPDSGEAQYFLRKGIANLRLNAEFAEQMTLSQIELVRSEDEYNVYRLR